MLRAAGIRATRGAGAGVRLRAADGDGGQREGWGAEHGRGSDSTTRKPGAWKLEHGHETAARSTSHLVDKGSSIALRSLFAAGIDEHAPEPEEPQ
jgi:hypothetical protein